MRYVMRQNLWSFGGDYTIQDEAGADRFRVERTVLSLRNEMTFRDLDGKTLVVIRKRLVALVPTYDIYYRQKLFAVVKKKYWLSLTQFGFHVDVGADGPDETDLEIEGEFRHHEYQFERAGRVVAQVSKRWLTLTDTFGVETRTGVADALVLACTVVIDQCTCGKGGGGIFGILADLMPKS